ncbi:MAG TPA: hypothetical protein VGK53_12575 [Propionicimonas sp.]
MVAIAALIVTGLARRDSRRSAGSSDASATAAADSAAVAEREEARRIERVDVKWKRVTQSADRRHHIEYRNTGTTCAFLVAAVFAVNGHRVHVQHDEVPAGESISYDATGMGRRVVMAASYGPGGTNQVHGTRYNVSARITWQSQLGTPGVWADGVA